jgi:hypothetical protein
MQEMVIFGIILAATAIKVALQMWRNNHCDDFKKAGKRLIFNAMKIGSERFMAAFRARSSLFSVLTDRERQLPANTELSSHKVTAELPDHSSTKSLMKVAKTMCVV